MEVTADAHFRRLVVYIHQNPQKHGFVDDFRQWPYSSYHTLLSFKKTNLHSDDVLAWFQGKAGFHAAHEQEILHQRILSLVPEEFVET
ncbi:MAG: hypothetical protein DCC55_23735 [Chloroflexi bacterium]|nr:MAG: hypothetical protein DCC55_23735 [Chloroflexota bacterium]